MFSWYDLTVASWEGGGGGAPDNYQKLEGPTPADQIKDFGLVNKRGACTAFDTSPIASLVRR